MDDATDAGDGDAVLPDTGAAGPVEDGRGFTLPFFMTAEYERRRALRRPRLADGTVFAGRSPDTGAVLHTRPDDESPHPVDFCLIRGCDIDALARRARWNGYQDWRIPSPAELQMMYLDRDLIRGFGGDWYWTSGLTSPATRVALRFSDGLRHAYFLERAKARLRLVRTP
ncbi:hypothetical protein J5J86_22650 [Aquabacter sp. L1I39]|uniref:hypothetical protein n=1 Tax=Aquabacter sp. L1I39 TaxID=2820278 RepID=UPI001ADD2FC7|nr:hypothetical protein [Aquabacter sp. L1I39]QTL03494.1 hypothetical protein J5J86_22650 [Aquabacter sp. L1I39]